MSNQEQPPPPDDADRGPVPDQGDAPPDRPRTRGPDFILAALDKNNQRRGTVGAGWYRKDGAIAITLNPGVVLSYADLQDCVITLFPKVK